MFSSSGLKGTRPSQSTSCTSRTVESVHLVFAVTERRDCAVVHEEPSVSSAQSLSPSANGRKDLKAESTIGDYLKIGWEAGSLANQFSLASSACDLWFRRPGGQQYQADVPPAS